MSLSLLSAPWLSSGLMWVTVEDGGELGGEQLSLVAASLENVVYIYIYLYTYFQSVKKTTFAVTKECSCNGVFVLRTFT